MVCYNASVIRKRSSLQLLGITVLFLFASCVTNPAFTQGAMVSETVNSNPENRDQVSLINTEDGQVVEYADQVIIADNESSGISSDNDSALKAEELAVAQETDPSVTTVIGNDTTPVDQIPDSEDTSTAYATSNSVSEHDGTETDDVKAVQITDSSVTAVIGNEATPVEQISDSEDTSTAYATSDSVSSETSEIESVSTIGELFFNPEMIVASENNQKTAEDQKPSDLGELAIDNKVPPAVSINEEEAQFSTNDNKTNVLASPAEISDIDSMSSIGVIQGEEENNLLTGSTDESASVTVEDSSTHGEKQSHQFLLWLIAALLTAFVILFAVVLIVKKRRKITSSSDAAFEKSKTEELVPESETTLIPLSFPYEQNDGSTTTLKVLASICFQEKIASCSVRFEKENDADFVLNETLVFYSDESEKVLCISQFLKKIEDRVVEEYTKHLLSSLFQSLDWTFRIECASEDVTAIKVAFVLKSFTNDSSVFFSSYEKVCHELNEYDFSRLIFVERVDDGR